MEERKIVGRTNELQHLKKSLEDALQGRGTTIVLEGDHGTGKTYLCEVFEGYCREKDILFIGADARRYDIERPYSVFIQILDNLRKEYPTMVPIGLSPFFTDKSMDIPDLRTAQSFLYEKVYGFIENMSRKGLVLFLDNIEWLDASSVGLFHYLALKAPQSSYLLLATYTPDDAKLNPDNKINEILALLTRERSCIKLKLGPLGKEEAMQIAKTHLKNPDRLLFGQIYENTRGNPGLIIQLCSQQSGLDLSTIAHEKLKDLYEHKITKLSTAAEKIAMTASIIGNIFDMNTLSTLTSQPEENLIEPLEELIEFGIIEEAGEKYIFKTPVLRAYLYSKLSPEKRKELHLTVADYIAKKMRESSEKVYALAYHYFHAGKYEIALRYLLRSAEMAYEEYAFERTLEFLKMADLCADYLGNIFVKAEIKSRMGDIYYGLGNFKLAKEYYTQILGEKGVQSDAKLLSALYRKLGNLANIHTEYWDALKYYEDALRVAEGGKHLHEIALAHRGIGYIYLRLGNWRKALDEYTQVMGIAKRLNNLWLTGIAFLELGNMYNMRGNLDDALTHYEMAAKNLEKVKSYLDIGRALCNAGEVYVQKEDYMMANEKFTQAKEYAKKSENESFMQWVEVNQGFCLVKFGDIEEAKKRCFAFIETCSLNNNRFGSARALRILGWAERERKNYQSALEFFMHAMEILESLEVQYEIGRELWEIGCTYEAMGMHEKSRSYYARALEILSAIGAHYYVKKIRLKLQESFERGGCAPLR
ncbi:MAG: BREX system ATP-binding domain-containing protein [Thermoplasmata archaeon]